MSHGATATKMLPIFAKIVLQATVAISTFAALHSIAFACYMGQSFCNMHGNGVVRQIAKEIAPVAIPEMVHNDAR